MVISVKKEVKNKNKKKRNKSKKLNIQIKSSFNKAKTKKSKKATKKLQKKIKNIKKDINKRINKLKKVNLKKEVTKLKDKLKDIDYKKEGKKILQDTIYFIKKYYYIFLMALPFILIDIITRILGQKINFYSINKLVPNLFTLIWISLIIGTSLSLSKKKGKAVYIVSFILSFALFITNNIYYSMTDSFFSFNLLGLASEGSEYFLDAIINCNIWVYISALIIILTFILALKYYPKVYKTSKENITKIFIAFLIIHTITPCFLGKANDDLEWSTWRNPRNIYINFNDSNKSMMVSGFYEYSFRDFYITYLKSKKTTNEEDLTFLEEEYLDEEEENYSNKYTSKYQDKNLIIIQLEGLDSWMLTEEDTPTLYKMMNNSINFTNHYSYYNGGGSTFNSEFAVNTGFITPLSYTQNAYTFNKNSFPYSLANLFKDRGYSVNAFHMNTSEYYSRGVNYKNWGYDNYYGLQDLGEYTDDSYVLDRELILNETFNELIFSEEKFVNYIIAYSSHLPFSTEKGVCKKLVTEDILKELNLLEAYNNGTVKLSYEKETNEENPLEYKTKLKLEVTKEDGTIETIYHDIPEMTEEECARRGAKETDYMVELLLQNLEEKSLLDDTVIAVFTDHYLYTLTDQTIIEGYKGTSNNLINKTPFFIWTTDNETKKVTEVTSQLNILPILANLFGLEYHPNYYIGSDALGDTYTGLVFFSDYSWYDGKVYVDGGEVTNGKYIDPLALEDKNYYINYIIRKNDLTLKYNYFKTIKEHKNKTL